eukprot:701139-Lingulodinium_polyedra.AAC.1
MLAPILARAWRARGAFRRVETANRALDHAVPHVLKTLRNGVVAVRNFNAAQRGTRARTRHART